MSNQEGHILNRVRPQKANNWWFVAAIILGLLLLFLMRMCNTGHNEFSSNQSNRIPDTIYRIIDAPIFPDFPNRHNPIDSTKIIIPDDSLNREIISNLLNVYLDDTVDLNGFAIQTAIKFPDDSIQVNYFAEEYKRIQFIVPDERRDSLMAELKVVFQQVKFVCVEAIYTQSFTSKDPYFKDEKFSWFYRQIGLYDAWDITRGDPQIKIAVIDDSFDPNHAELENQIVDGWNVVDYSVNLTSYNGAMIHGTHVAGTVAGEDGNNIGLSGVAPLCSIMPIQIGDKQGRMTTSAILDAIFYALKNKASVINLSLGINTPSAGGGMSIAEQKRRANELYTDEAAMWDEVFAIAESEGAIVVQAAGNSNVLAALDPMKRSQHCLVVGATDRAGNRADFSNFGDNVTVFAPGVDIYSSLPNNKLDKMSGTSMASPIIAGSVALMLSLNNNLSLSDIKKVLQATGKAISGQKGKFIQVDKILSKI
ncbi:MAG: S8 family serine peptidase [Crocinitomix sp.]|nr:S8 family serine peptidase [Crocinitomix sp.]